MLVFTMGETSLAVGSIMFLLKFNIQQVVTL